MKCSTKWMLAVILSLATTGVGAAQSHSEDAGLRFALIRTSGTTTLEALTFSGGSWFKKAKMNHMAVLVEHPQGRFLFDTGLGREIDEQYEQDMPLWMRPMLSYEPATPARDQLDKAGYPPIKEVILSHVHWDHASGVPDFPEARIWVLPEDKAYIDDGPRGPVMPSQFAHNDLKWYEYNLREQKWGEYKRSLDVYGDGSVILIGMPGHTPGSVGLYLKTGSGRKYLFSGDIVWNVDALQEASPKMLMARKTADADADKTQLQINKLARLSKSMPDLTIVPAHDANVHNKLGYFPDWID